MLFVQVEYGCVSFLAAIFVWIRAKKTKNNLKLKIGGRTWRPHPAPQIQGKENLVKSVYDLSHGGLDDKQVCVSHM